MNTGGKQLKTAFLEMITMMNLKLSNRPLTLLLSVSVSYTHLTLPTKLEV